MKRIAISNPSFQEIRTKNCIYVDKTEYIYSLVKEDLNNYYSISRPRRFGKSLMCSTLHALFEGKRELFKGLYIDSTDYSFEKYPVLHFNFAEFSTDDYDSFLDDFQIAIINNAQLNGIELERSEPSIMISSFLYNVGKKAVIIVDEFDTPITHTYKNIELADRIRNTLSVFYSVIKNRNENVRFFFLTGITKFSNMSIFSQMNNLIDLTFNKKTASLFGYTEEELESNFSDYIDEYLNRDDREYRTREEFLSAIRDYYDGYRFSYESAVKVYNPVSVGSFFNEGCSFKNYWINTGVSTLAVELAKEYKLDRIISENPILSLSAINTFDYSLLAKGNLKDSQVLALIYFTGYLTIYDGDSEGLTLTFPNTEVRKSFTESLVEMFTGIDVSTYAVEGVRALRVKNLEKLTKTMNAFLNEFPYFLIGKREKSYQEAFYAFFLMIGGCRIDAEEETLSGRSDCVLSRSRDVYIIEMKVDRNAEEAIEQIKKKRYYARYINSEKTIHIIGMNFSSNDRQIKEWKEEIVDKTKEKTYLG